jgi:hypothetical protein
MGSEGGQHDFIKFRPDRDQQVANRNPCVVRDWRSLRWSLAKRYVEGKVNLHVHLSIDSGVPGESGDWCAVLYWPALQKVVPADLDLLGMAEGKASSRQMNLREVNKAVLIHYREFLNAPKRFPLWVVLPCGVWLQALNSCPCVLGHSADLASGLVLEFSVVFENGELRPRRGGLTIGKDQLPGEVVKSGSEIVKNITDDQSPLMNRGRIRNSGIASEFPLMLSMWRSAPPMESVRSGSPCMNS